MEDNRILTTQREFQRTPWQPCWEKRALQRFVLLSEAKYV